MLHKDSPELKTMFAEQGGFLRSYLTGYGVINVLNNKEMNPFDFNIGAEKQMYRLFRLEGYLIGTYKGKPSCQDLITYMMCILYAMQGDKDALTFLNAE